MKLFAIRHKPSGLFLPAVNPDGRIQARGFTRREPSNKLPRLFPTARAARIALTCWLKGEWHNEYSETLESGWEYDGPAPTVRRPDRKAEDMEVIPMRLSVAPERKPFDGEVIDLTNHSGKGTHASSSDENHRP